MGAGGSTAISCSSLDVGGGKQHYRRYQQQHQHHQLYVEQKMHKYRNKAQQLAGAARGTPRSGSPLKSTQGHLIKHSNSYFDLSTVGVQNHHMAPQVAVAEPKKQSAARASRHFDTSNQSEACYSLSNASFGISRPIMVLPVSPTHHRQQLGRSEPQIKRAISLSSLHNLHNHHHQQHANQQHHHHNPRHYPHHHPQQQQHTEHDNSNCKQQVAVNKLNTKHKAIRSAVRSESMNSYVPCDLRQPCSKRQVSHRQQQQQQHQPPSMQQVQNVAAASSYSQQMTPLGKKIQKFKHIAHGNAQSSKKYQKKHQPSPPQQGCPVLPVLPRSQSLHELIQLRATENGQRMRTTGTLRGPLGGEQACNKVNLVVELLESRRQQKQSIKGDSVTMLSQGSSSDDGIHDVSITAGDHSTGDSRHKSISSNINNDHHEASCEQGRQRVFLKKNPQSAAPNRYSQQNFQISERPQSQKVDVMVAKSTLKRSVSHSALQRSLETCNNTDTDESYDLNELAKFLYQFKQRQAANKARSSSDLAQEVKIDEPQSGTPTKPTTTTTTATTCTSKSTATNLQQSPSSTTSSSGFASSTCTSNSISSTASGELLMPTKSSGAARKKYPAPPRPDESLKEQSKTKCLISGKLKLSSSLLSIVDEYNSSLHSADREAASPAAGGTNPRLTSVLLGGELKGSSDQHVVNKTTDDEVDSSCHQQRQQLEQLKRYTQLRQMSQSELALNHLISSSPRGQQQQEEKRGKPYKSKLINLIRRISDKSEVDSANQRVVGLTHAGGNAAGGHQSGQSRQDTDHYHQQLRAINQSEKIVPYSNQCRQRQPQECERNKAAAVANAGGRGGCLSESLCDLNFDCDFELMKNCGSGAMAASAIAVADEHGSRKAMVDQRAGSSLLLLSPADGQTSSPLAGGAASAAAADRRQQKEATRKHQVIDSSHNWRLVQAPFSLAKPTATTTAATKQATTTGALGNGGSSSNNNNNGGGCKACHQQQQKKQHTFQLPNESGKDGRPLCKLHGSSATAAADKVARQQQQQQPKLKWSAGDWLMNGSSGVSSKSKQLQQQPSAEDSGKSCLAKLISSSRAPSLSAALSGKELHSNKTKKNKHDATDKSSAKLKNALPIATTTTASSTANTNNNLARVSNEANQLLNDLDLSLDLVSGNSSPFSRKAAVSWWQFGDEGTDSGARNGMRNGGDMGLLSDDDSEDDANYASINRAMINAALGVDLIHTPMAADHKAPANNLNSQLSIEPGSPSDSFTFSAPSSPKANAELCSSGSETGHQTRNSCSRCATKELQCSSGKGSGGANGADKISMKKQESQPCQKVSQKQELFGKLRNSLLSPKLEPTTKAPVVKSPKLAASQVSLVNYYSGTHFVSPFIGSTTQQLASGKSNVKGSTYLKKKNSASNSQLNMDYDDNFLLKRKPPNAGLKLH